MIVESMTYDEIACKYNEIYEKVEPRYMAKADCNKMRRFLVKNKKAENVWFKPIKFEIDLSTVFCFLPFALSYKDFQKCGNHPYTLTYMHYIINKGYMVVVRGGEYNNNYAFYTSHFFDRYRERELKNLSLEKEIVIMEFFKNNRNFCSRPFPKLDSENYIGVTDSGIIFSRKINDNITIYKTFITKEDLKGDQLDAVAEVGEGLEDLLQYREQLRDLVLSQFSQQNYF